MSALQHLIDILQKLPGIGPKSAQRMAYHFLQHDRDVALQLSDALKNAISSILHCQKCNTFSESPLCELCTNAKRDPTLLCVTETPADLLVIEQTLTYQGLYFVLMGQLSPLDGIGPNDLHFTQLIQRATDGIVKEVILATNFNNEGEATAHYISEVLKSRGIQVSRLARGVPIGAELGYVDIGTVARAFLDRKTT